MIAELFNMLSNFSVSSKNGTVKFRANLNRRNIRSISAFSSNSIFYFKTAVTDQATPEEIAMVARMLEKSYASFVVACISLMPFHRVKADDQAAIESYLSQFHQNLGINAGSDAMMTKLFALADNISESASKEDLEAAGNFLMECWEKAHKNCERTLELVAEHVCSVNEMYSIPTLDPTTKLMMQRHERIMDEMATWGFLGEATGNMLDNFDELDDLTDTDIINAMLGGSEDDDDDIDEDEIPDSALMEGNVKGAINSIIFSLESVSENKIKSCSSLTKLNSLEAKLNKMKNKYAKYLNRYKRKYKENKENKSKSKLTIRFNGETISNPKAFMKQYGGYIKIINKRLKLVEARRAELRKRKGITADAPVEESAIGVLSDIDLSTIDFCIESIDKQLAAPDEEIFSYVLSEASEEQMMSVIEDQEERIKALADHLETSEKNNRAVVSARDQAIKDLARTQARLSVAQGSEKELNAIIADQKKTIDRLEAQVKDTDSDADDISAGDIGIRVDWKKRSPAGNINLAKAAANGQTNFQTFGKEIFTDMDMKKANEAIPTFAKATIGFVIDDTEQVVNRDILIGIKVHIDKVPAMDLISDLYNCVVNKRQFLKFVKWISGEEKSLADLLFGFKELKTDALNSRNGAGRWGAAFRQRKRWAKMSVPYLTKGYLPNGTVVITMNEVQFIKDEYGIDIMMPEHVRMLMEQTFLLGFVILDQANEMVYVSYDGHGGEFEQYTYAMLAREGNQIDKQLREMYRAFSR